jgi:hypothetical protein
MTRFNELMAAVKNDTNLMPLIKEMVYLEEYLDELRGLPKIKVDPKNPQRQKATPAAKMYKEYLQQYINIVKVILRASGTDQTDEESPLRKWMNAHVDQ